MTTEIKCPYHKCPGTLELVYRFQTDMFTLPYDRNHFSETFKCSSCGKRIERHWQWIGEDKNDTPK